MKSDILDKFLILLLIITLPVSIFLTSQYGKKIGQEKEKKLQEEQMVKLNQALTEIRNNETTNQQAIQTDIKIDEINFATKSGELTISGSAPVKNLNIVISAITTPAKIKAKSDKRSSKSGELSEEVLGQKVDVVAVKTDNDGKFEFVKKIDSEKIGLIDIRLDQGEASLTVQYSFLENKRTL
jgi:hypothetical protein